MEEQNEIYLGYLELPQKPHLSHRRFFPSKVGGKPGWLFPKHLPHKLLCTKCECTLTFILQIYASRDDPITAFHRMLYVFGCNQCGDEFRIVRCQIPRHNPFYNSAPANPDVDIDLFDECLESFCCSTCGLPNESLTTHHKDCLVFKERLIEIEQEEENENDDDIQANKDLLHEKELLKVYEEKAKNLDEVLDFTEAEVFQQLQKPQDKQFEEFLEYMDRNPNHIIRYSAAGGKPLWYHSFGLLDTKNLSLDCCPLCGSEREFEFQIEPNLIFELPSKKFNFGVLCIYTCKKSCTPSDENPYTFEIVVKQTEEESPNSIAIYS